MNGHDEGNNQQETPVAGIISITLIASGTANSTIIIDDDGAAFFFTPFIIVRWLLKFCTASVMKCNTGDVEVSRHAHDFTFLRTIFLASGNAHPFLLFVYTLNHNDRVSGCRQSVLKSPHVQTLTRRRRQRRPVPPVPVNRIVIRDAFKMR